MFSNSKLDRYNDFYANDPTKEAMDELRKCMNEKEDKLAQKSLKLLFKEEDKECLCGRCKIMTDYDYCCQHIYASRSDYQAPLGKTIANHFEKTFWKGEHQKCVSECAGFSKYLDEEVLTTFKSGYKYAKNAANFVEWKPINYRFYSYSMFIADTKLNLSKKRIPIPSCIVCKIREKWPDKEFVGFTGVPFSYEEEEEEVEE